MLRGWMALVAPVVLLCGCAPLRAPPVAYACEGGMRIELRFEREQALATLADGYQVRLQQQPSGSGFWYAGEGHVLRGKGREAQWTVGQAAPVACLVIGP
ncbi:MliC family protein [Pseudorhodoferax sp.]|uniref:MliC family protein n=1 Tax=Pseudorhodoferax sp. TaxID=1993553 RepID=UPI002DD6A76A|nr:MliC family protein [Pseudorhodoferax sp.]